VLEEMMAAELGLELVAGLRFHIHRHAGLEGLEIPDLEQVEVELHLQLDQPAAAVAGGWSPNGPQRIDLALPAVWRETLAAGPWYDAFDGLVTVEVATWDSRGRPTLALFADWVVTYHPRHGWQARPDLLWAQVDWDPTGGWDVLTPEGEEAQAHLSRLAAERRDR